MKLINLIMLLSGLLANRYSLAQQEDEDVHLTLIPPGMITDQVALDIRAGLKNHTAAVQQWNVAIYLDKVQWQNRVYRSVHVLQANEGVEIRHVVPPGKLLGNHTIILKVSNDRKEHVLKKPIEVVSANGRSTQTIDGAWAGIYHWSEKEGKHWNNDLRQLTGRQWKTMVAGMHRLGMDMIVIQEVFRNNDYAGKNSLTVENYPGKAFYPSALYPGRMSITAKDPVEAILSAADSLRMHVWVGVGLFAWFDFSAASLEWHKRVAAELWQKYGHHTSFYGFYISEEMGGSLDNWETTDSMRQFRKSEMIHFFREFKKFCKSMAPAKPIMLATNSMEVPKGADAYPELLKYLDVLCPFGFARMPENDLTGEKAAELLQKFCDEAGAHLWFDLEAFLFNPDTSLYPRDLPGILHDLTLFQNFEKIICYQYPGVFNDPSAGFRVGESSTIALFKGYLLYQQKQRQQMKEATIRKKVKKQH